MGFKHSRTILPHQLEILEGSTDKSFSMLLLQIKSERKIQACGVSKEG